MKVNFCFCFLLNLESLLEQKMNKGQLEHLNIKTICEKRDVHCSKGRS